MPDYIVLLKPFEVIKEFYNGEFKGRRFPYYIVLLKLYLKLRSTNYDAYSVRDEITAQIESLIKANKAGIGNADYLILSDVRDRDFLEEKGTLRRDFTISVYRKGG